MNALEWVLTHEYQINAGSGILLTLGLSGLALLMALIRPNTLLKSLTLWWALCLSAVMWRWTLDVLQPGLFGLSASLLPSVVFAIAAVSTFALMAVAWRDYLRSARRRW